MSSTRCSSPDAFTLASDADVTEWVGLDLEIYPSGKIMNLIAPDHTQGKVHVRFNFEDGGNIETEIWRWSQTQNTSNLGPWALYLPNFEDLGMPSPTSIDVKLEGLYEYSPLTNQRVEVDVCDEEVL